MATEKRLIDATPIIDECKECSIIEWNKSVYTTWAEAEEDFMQRLLDAPTVDAVEVVHGRWIRKPIGKYTGVDEVCCSNCGYFVGVVASDAGFGEAIDGFNYCPNCGAKMEGE